MARKPDNRVVNVSVVGLSGTEKEKGITGIGKSCLCNRFMHPQADDYYTDHISVLSQSDLGGRVVNNDHFLYWGDTTKTSDEGVDCTFLVIEQTEFVDDSSFQPFKCGKTEPYYKRCAATKLQSAEKLMYIRKDQLGLEHEFPQKFLPDGKMAVDGFLCLFDTSDVVDRPIERQVEHAALILNSLVKTKKPIVVVTTKNEEGLEQYVREAEKLVARKEYKGNIPLVETSAHLNVNVELAFFTLVHLIDRVNAKTGKVKTVPYCDAACIQKELRDVATEAYLKLIREHVFDYKALWIPVHRKLQQHENYIHFRDLCGTEQAKRLFRRHVNQLKDAFVKRKLTQYLENLKYVMRDILPDLSTVNDRSWPATLRWLQRQDFLEDYFAVLGEGVVWYLSDFIESSDARIPFDLLGGPEAEIVYRNHVNALRAEHKRQELMKQFRQLLVDNYNVCPGKSLGEMAIFFLGRECFTSLSEEDKTLVYEQHQRELRERAKRDYLELLLENAAMFSKFEHREVRSEDLREINQRLQEEPRYRALSRLEEDRKVILLNHLGFTQKPSQDKCPFRDKCMDTLITRVLATKAHRPQSWSRNSQFLLDAEDKRLNLVLLGSERLATQLVHEIRLQCVEDEYTLDGEIFSLDYRPIDGDVSLPQNSFKTADFKPHGCFCVFNSLPTLYYIRDSLERTVMSDLHGNSRQPFQGLPLVVILAHNDAISEGQLQALRVEGQALADRLQCPFTDTPSSMMVDPSRLFHQDQIGLAVHSLVKCIKHRSSFVNPWQIAVSIEPDIRVLMCFMCDDSFAVELPLSPLLNHQCCYVTSEKFPTITLETYLDDSKRKVEVTVTSYHGATLVRDGLYHGYILVYCARRTASLATLRSFASVLPLVPTRIMAMTESGGANAFFASESSQKLLTEGNKFADQIGASFMTTCANFHLQTASYTPFFKECWDRKNETESAFTFSEDGLSDQHEENRPFEALTFRPQPRPPPGPRRPDMYGVAKSSSNSQSPDDSDPIYDQPHLGPCHSDSEGDQGRPSSADSPTQPPHGDRFTLAYSDISQPDTEQLLKANQLSKRAMYAGSAPVFASLASRLQLAVTSRDTRPAARKLQKSTTLPTTSCNSRNSVLYEDAGDTWDPNDKRSPPPLLPKPPDGGRPQIGALDLTKYAEVRKVLTNNMNSGTPSLVKAPLATPEHIEIGETYAQVKDALPPPDNDYAEVTDALPSGRVLRIRSTFQRPKDGKGGDGSDSDSECSSLERRRREEETIYSRVKRRPTPHKKRTKPRLSDSTLPPPVPPLTDERQVLVTADLLDKMRCQSQSEGSEGTGDELFGMKKALKKKRSSRSKPRRFQDGGGDGVVSVCSPPWSDTDQSFSPLSRQADEAAYEGADTVDARFRFKDKDEKQRQKDEKKAREDEKKKKKEEEKKQREDQKSKQKAQKTSRSLISSLRGRDRGGAAQNNGSATLDDLRQSDTNPVPLFVALCVSQIEQEGMLVEGIYRVPGSKAHVDMLWDKYREDNEVNFTALDIPVNAVATALKQFFAELVDPLLPDYEDAIDAAVNPDVSARIESFKQLLFKLPQPNYKVLKFLIAHIQRVSKHAKDNSMDSQNLAICWWPTLYRPHVASLESMATVSRYLSEVIQSFIDHFDYLFDDDQS